MDFFNTLLESAGPFAPVIALALFLVASALMIWRLGVLEDRGFEGTVLGTLVMPYCSGISNLVFAWLMGRKGGSGVAVMENCLVNNVTNLTLLIGLPALLWGLNIMPKPGKGSSKGGKGKAGGGGAVVVQKLNRLSLLLTLVAAFFFTGALWVLGRDGRLDADDGVMLVGIFLFWQIFQVFDVMKKNVQQKRAIGFIVVLDLALILAGACGVFVSVEWLVAWVEDFGKGFFGRSGIGWLSGWLMVLPNAMLSLYYARRGRPDIAYSSQVGDGHICIPLCLGLFALNSPMRIAPSLEIGCMMIAAATAIHCASLVAFGRLPRWLGGMLVVGYGFFVYKGVVA